MGKFYRQIKDGLYGEVGHVYLGDENIVVPPGFVGCINEMTTVEYNVVFPEDMVEEISESQYKAIEEADYIDEEKIALATEVLSKFKQSANELHDVWLGLSMAEEELSGLHRNYPFELDFGDLIYSIIDWGTDKKD